MYTASSGNSSERRIFYRMFSKERQEGKAAEKEQSKPTGQVVMKKDIRAYTYEELQEEVKMLGEKAFRAKQIYEWLHQKQADSFDEMTNLSKNLRTKLEKEYEIFAAEPVERQESALDKTNKFLFRLYDGNVVESVLMRYKHGNSVCISSQVGCRMGCRFCASTDRRTWSGIFLHPRCWDRFIRFRR